MDYSIDRKALCKWAVSAYRTGLFEGTCGNYSLYNREAGYVVITPSSLPYDQYTPEDMVVIDLDGNVIDGIHNPSSEWSMHTTVYKCKPDVCSVIHTHSPHASAFAVMHRSIPLILVEMVPTLGGDIPLADFAMTGTPEMGEAVMKVLTDRHGCLLMNHGVLAVGEDLATAFTRAGYIENAAKICAIADSATGAIPLDDQQFRLIREHFDID